MSSAFAELGVCDEIVQGLDKIGWALPTDIQAEAVPLILGGGDVLMAAETGSGKTGAFCLPVIQIVNETKQESGKPQIKRSKPAGSVSCKLSMEERSDIVAVSPDGLQMQCRDFRLWGGCRSTWATKENAVAFYEVTCTDEGLSRFGFGTITCDLNLGTCPEGFGFGGTGKKSNRRQFDSYGEPFGQGDIIGCLIDRQRNEIKYFKNGRDLGVAFQIPNSMNKEPLYAICCLKNAEVAVNYDGPFKHPPGGNFTAYGKMDASVRFAAGAGPSVKTGNTKGLPMAIILEPSRELAQQTEQCIEDFSQYLPSPSVNSVCLVGGGDSRYQKQIVEEGVDIVVGTPGRLEDFINSGVLKLDNVRFLIVDECDALLAQNQQRLIENIHRKCPHISPEGRRLQMVVCSATLHNFNVKKLAQKLMSFPTWVDLKGEDSVPDTVHHCVALVDPTEDRSWFDLYRNKKGIITDRVHQSDQVSNAGQNCSDESVSEGIKKLKGEYVVRIIKAHKMEKAIIFCRTKLDCDNLERLFINNYGGGPYSKGNSDFSCVCLHSDRKPNERKANLERFKRDEVRFLICTDVAARGIDVKGVPYVINVTMPDDKANYLHRIGRVGRADCMGLAISLVAKQREKVWYHSNCRTRGNGCFNTNDIKHGGCTIWYNEMALLGEVEDHLKDTIEHIDPKTMLVPVNEFDGKVVYGRKNIEGSNNILTGHYRELLPTLNELKRLEKSAQGSFIELCTRGTNIFA